MNELCERVLRIVDNEINFTKAQINQAEINLVKIRQGIETLEAELNRLELMKEKIEKLNNEQNEGSKTS